MVQGDIVKRIWSKNSQISEHNDILDIWDTGSNIYERWPNGDEFYWRVVSREETQTGFIEILEQEPMWKTPAQVLRREQIPLLKQSTSEFQLGAWSVEQVVEKACRGEKVDMIQAHRQQVHRQAVNKTSLQGPQRQQVQRKPQGQQKPQGQRKPQAQHVKVQPVKAQTS